MPELEAILRELESFAAYDEENGGFIITRCRHPKHPVGSEAGTLDLNHGYRKISIKTGKYKYRNHYVHQLVWLWHTGTLPKKEIDHLDGDNQNNRIENLREVCRTTQMRNCKLDKRSISGYTGVTWHPCGKWRARVVIDKKEYHLGLFDTTEQAHAARMDFINSHNNEWGFTDRHTQYQTPSNESNQPSPIQNLRITL